MIINNEVIISLFGNSSDQWKFRYSITSQNSFSLKQSKIDFDISQFSKCFFCIFKYN